MKLKRTTLQPVLGSSESSWYEDPMIWVAIGASAATAYFVGGKLQEGMKVVLPAALGSTLVWGAGIGSWILRKIDRTYVLAVVKSHFENAEP